jgi:hypothetical protein
MYKLIDDYYQPIEPGKKGVLEQGMFFWTCPHRPHIGPMIKRWTSTGVRMMNVTQFDPAREKDDPASGTNGEDFWGLTNYHYVCTLRIK